MMCVDARSKRQEVARSAVALKALTRGKKASLLISDFWLLISGF